MANDNIKIMHMASFSRSGETLMLRCLNAHPDIHVVHNLIAPPESKEDFALFRLLQKYGPTSISRKNPIVKAAGITKEKIIIVKNAVWEHKHPFDGFILVRNPFSVAESFKIFQEKKELFQKHKEQFNRWGKDIDALLIDGMNHEDNFHCLCALYNRKMFPLANMGLPVVYYEEFVKNPEKALKSLIKSFGLKWDEAVLNSHEAYKEGEYGHGKLPLWKPIHSESLEKYKNLPKEVLSEIYGLTYPTLRAYHYEVLPDLTIHAPTVDIKFKETTFTKNKKYTVTCKQYLIKFPKLLPNIRKKQSKNTFMCGKKGGSSKLSTKGFFKQLYKYTSQKEFNGNTHISLKHNIIYYEVPKAATSYINDLLFKIHLNKSDVEIPRPHTHFLNSPMVKPYQLSEDTIAHITQSKDFLNFTVVRNPYDRVLSGYLDKIIRGKKQKKQILKALDKDHNDLDTELSFQQFLEGLHKIPSKDRSTHWREQTIQAHSHFIDMNYTLKFENLEDDLLHFFAKTTAYKQAKKIILQNSFISKNKTNANIKRKEFYDRTCTELVNKIYKEDFTTFGYTQLENAAEDI